MAQNRNVFIDTKEAPDVLAKELATVLQIKLQPVTDNPHIFYRFAGEKKWLTLGDHFLENDRDLNFEDFAYQIEVGAKGIHDWQEREQVRDEFACLIFDQLKNLGKYRLMLVDDVQVKLAEFLPSPEMLP